MFTADLNYNFYNLVALESTSLLDKTRLGLSHCVRCIILLRGRELRFQTPCSRRSRRRSGCRRADARRTACLPRAPRRPTCRPGARCAPRSLQAMTEHSQGTWKTDRAMTNVLTRNGRGLFSIPMARAQEQTVRQICNKYPRRNVDYNEKSCRDWVHDGD